MTTVYHAGGEDEAFYQIGGGLLDTTSGHFRSAFARCALAGKNANVSDPCGWKSWESFGGLSAFWFHARAWSTNTTLGAAIVAAFFDSGNIERIIIRNASATASSWQVCKVNAAGTITQLGSNFTVNISNAAIDVWDVNMNYGSSGTITVYFNGVRVFTFSGDTTTDGNTTLSYYFVGGYSGSGASTSWSELIIADTDTRSLSLQTLAPVANGNTHNFDTGSPAAANVNETTLNDLTLDGSTTAGQIDGYTIPALASGTFSIVAIGVSARAQKGVSGPSKMDLGVRSGSTDYWSADQALSTAWNNYQNWWMTDPNTSAAWGALPANIEIKSVT